MQRTGPGCRYIRAYGIAVQWCMECLIGSMSHACGDGMATGGHHIPTMPKTPCSARMGLAIRQRNLCTNLRTVCFCGLGWFALLQILAISAALAAANAAFCALRPIPICSAHLLRDSCKVALGVPPWWFVVATMERACSCADGVLPAACRALPGKHGQTACKKECIPWPHRPVLPLPLV